MGEALRAHAGLIADEVLATSFVETSHASGFTDAELGFAFNLTKA
jgi:isoleucyl-tRNA synthetase